MMRFPTQKSESTSTELENPFIQRSGKSLNHDLWVRLHFQILLSIFSIPDVAQSAGEDNNLFSDTKDTRYIAGFNRLNDFRANYGSIGSSLMFGSNNQTGTNNTLTYFNNVNDILGIGLTYKIIDFDIAYSLPDTRL